MEEDFFKLLLLDTDIRDFPAVGLKPLAFWSWVLHATSYAKANLVSMLSV